MYQLLKGIFSPCYTVSVVHEPNHHENYKNISISAK